LMSKGNVAHRGAAAEVLTESNIAEHYGATVRVETFDDTVLVVPRLDTGPTTPPPEALP